MKQIRAQIDETTSDYDREKLQERLAKLVGGVAVIKVGAATETEMKEKKARVEDAMHATRRLSKKASFPAAAWPCIRASKALDNLKLEGDQKIGVAHHPRAIEEPARWIATNAGLEGSIIVGADQGRQGRRRLQRRDRELRRSRQGRRHRSDQGRPHRAAERRRRSRRCCSPPKPSISEIPEEKKEAGGGGHGMPGGGMGGMY